MMSDIGQSDSTQPVEKVKIKIKRVKGLSEFLKSNKFDKSKDSTPTNTRIADAENGIFGGSYTIPDDKYCEFIELYFQEIVSKNRCEYLTEKQLDKGGPILVDIDMRFAVDIKERQYTDEHVADIVDIYLAELKNIFQFDEDTNFPVYILEKPRVNCLEDKTKDGLHMIIGIQADRTTQVMLRERVLPKLEEVWADSLPLTNSWEDILDKGISIGHCNWQLYGSCKPNNDKYVLTKAYDIKFDITDREFQMDRIDVKGYVTKDTIFKLSARYPDHYSAFFTTAFSEKYRERSEKSGKTKQRPITPSPALSNTVLSNFMLTGAAVFANIRSREQLDEMMAHFIELADQEAREIYGYTMILPRHYYESGSYDRWIRVGWVLRHLNQMYFIIWLNFSAQATNFDFDVEVPKMWDMWDKTRMVEHVGLTKRSLMYWAKMDAREEYMKVRTGTLDYYLEQTIDSPLRALGVDDDDKKPTGCGEADLVEVLYHMKKDEFVCVNVRDNIWYQFKDHRWFQIDSGTTLRSSITTDLRKEYSKKANDLALKMAELPDGDNRVEAMKKRLERIMAIVQRLGKTGDKKNMMIEAKDRFYDSEFLKLLDMNPYLMCFRNGIWDFKAKVFRPGKPDDYLSISTGIDYITIESVKDPFVIEEVKQFMRQLFPIPALEKYMWQHLASTLIGVAVDQTFNNYIGGGSNGKSVLTNLMGMILGGYKYDLPHTAITSKERTKVGGTSPEIVALKGKRYVVMAEPSKGDVINEGIMKQFTAGNDKITARGMYMIDALEFLPQFKLVVCANQLLKINTMDHGTWRRIRLVDFVSRFTNNPVDNDPENPYQFKLIPDIEKKFDGPFKLVFMSMLVEIVLKTEGKVDDCDIVMAASDRYRQSQDIIAAFMNETYEQCPGARLVNKSCVNEDFKRWTMENGIRGHQAKEVHEYMDKKFGKPVGGKWLNAKRKDIYNDDDDIDTDESSISATDARINDEY